MRITTRITVTIERANGTEGEITETFIRTCGDNPQYEAQEIKTAITAATSQIINRTAHAMQSAPHHHDPTAQKG